MFKTVVGIVLVVLIATVVAQEESCACEDIPPTINGTSEFDCAEQSAWEKCDEDWMEGFCECTCGTCPLSAPTVETTTIETTEDLDGANDTEVVANNDTEVVAVADTQVAPGEPVELGVCAERDEPKNCADSRKRCCSGCGSETDVDFQCQQFGGSFASSCSCASSGGSAMGRARASSILSRLRNFRA